MTETAVLSAFVFISNKLKVNLFYKSTHHFFFILDGQSTQDFNAFGCNRTF